MYVCQCICEHTHTICSRHAHQQWISQGELRSARTDVPEEGADIDWNGSRGEIAGWLYPHFTPLISKAHNFYILRELFTDPKNIATPQKMAWPPAACCESHWCSTCKKNWGKKKSGYISLKEYWYCFGTFKAWEEIFAMQSNNIVFH